MQKRSDETKQEKVFFRTKLKHTAVVVLCILFALSTIYAVDISTYKLKQNETDQYAVRIVRQDENTLRLDWVGKQYQVDIERFKVYAGKLAQTTKELMGSIQGLFK